MRALSIRLSFLVLVLAACNRDRVEKKQQPEVTNWSLWEIYENVQHANSTRMIEEHPQPGAPHKESLEACEVYGKRCKTSQEFDNLIRPYMND